jgi:hypothetical protein
MAVPTSHRSLDVRNRAAAASPAKIPIVDNLQFKLMAGVYIHAASARPSRWGVMTGTWPAASSASMTRRFDQWAPEGHHNIGYVSQAIKLSTARSRRMLGDGAQA